MAFDSTELPEPGKNKAISRRYTRSVHGLTILHSRTYYKNVRKEPYSMPNSPGVEDRPL
jgi:hypothetical protein